MTVGELKRNLESFPDDYEIKNLQLHVQYDKNDKSNAIASNLKLFKVSLSNPDKWEYDTYTGCIILARDKEHVMELLENEDWVCSQEESFRIDYDYVITEIDISKIMFPRILLSQFVSE